jgi:serine/threonine protein kinase
MADYDWTTLKLLGEGSQGSASTISTKDGSEIFVLKEFESDEVLWREANILRYVNHPHVIRPVCIVPKRDAMILPFLEEGDLSQVRSDTTDSLLKKWSAQLVAAVYAIHLAGFMHMDIKPKNLGISKSSLILFDFGLACSKNNRRKRAGTPSTIAPEVALPALNRSRKGTASDWWSVGSTIWQIHALRHTGSKPAFSTDAFPYEVLRGRKTKMIKKFIYHDFPEYFSEDLKSLLELMLTLNPQHRDFDQNIQKLQDHPYFKDVDWSDILSS